MNGILTSGWEVEIYRQRPKLIIYFEYIDEVWLLRLGTHYIYFSKIKYEHFQVTVSSFHQWNNIAGHVVPIILALFFGNWSDRRGRKLPLIIGLLGKFIYSFMVVINSMMDTWDLNTIVYTASLPMGMLGGDVAIFGSCFAYISDISSVQQRTLRITILDVVYLSTMPTGKWNSIFYLVLKSIMILKIYILINELWMFM